MLDTINCRTCVHYSVCKIEHKFNLVKEVAGQILTLNQFSLQKDPELKVKLICIYFKEKGDE